SSNNDNMTTTANSTLGRQTTRTNEHTRTHTYPHWQEKIEREHFPSLQWLYLDTHTRNICKFETEGKCTVHHHWPCIINLARVLLFWQRRVRTAVITYLSQYSVQRMREWKARNTVLQFNLTVT